MEQIAAYHHASLPVAAAVHAQHNPHYPYPPPPQQAPHLAPYQQQPAGAGMGPQPYQFAPHYQDEVRTLFVAGLPEDVKYREIYNLFHEFPGFHSCQLKNSGQTQAYAFAVFYDQQSAVSAMHALNGLMFDLELEATLHVDLAKSNSRSKRFRTDSGDSGSLDKKVRGSGAFSSSLSDSGDAACPTLFVANLGPTCTEEELMQVFSRFGIYLEHFKSTLQTSSAKMNIKQIYIVLPFVDRCPGFLKVKMQQKRGLPVAFADFQDVACSTGAMNHLQGSFLHSSDGEGMRLEYARTRMGLPRRG